MMVRKKKNQAMALVESKNRVGPMPISMASGEILSLQHLWNFKVPTSSQTLNVSYRVGPSSPSLAATTFVG